MANKSKESFGAKFSDAFGEGYNNHEATISRKANELWTLTELRPGDIVVANRGISHVLAIGTVLDPPYDFKVDPAREDYSHLVRVQWDTTVAKDIPQQGFWALTTVADVPSELYDFILGEDEVPSETKVVLQDHVEPPFQQIRDRIASQGLRISARSPYKTVSFL